MNQSILKHTNKLTFVELICPMPFDVAGEVNEDGIALGNKEAGQTIRVIVPSSGVEKAVVANMFNVEFYPNGEAGGTQEFPLVGLLSLYTPPMQSRMYEYGAVSDEEGGHKHGPTQFIFDQATAYAYGQRFESLRPPCRHHKLVRSFALETANTRPINVYAGGAVVVGYALDDHYGTATPFAESVPDWAEKYGGANLSALDSSPFFHVDGDRILVMGVIVHTGEDLDFFTVKEYFHTAHSQGRDAAREMWTEAMTSQHLNRAKRVMKANVPGFAEAAEAFERGDLVGGIDAIAAGMGLTPKAGPEVYVMGDNDKEPRHIGSGVMAVEEAIRQATGGKAPGQEGGPHAH